MWAAANLTSMRTQLPYGYYTLPYCRPGNSASSTEELVGLVETPYKVIIECLLLQICLSTSRSYVSLAGGLQVMTRVDVQCKVLCRSNGLTAAQAEAFTLAIKGQHRVNM